MAIKFNIGTLAANSSSTVISYQTSLDNRDIASIIADLNSRNNISTTTTTNTNEEVNKVITAIVNTNAIKVDVPKITPPVIQPQTVKTTITPPIDLGFGEGTKVSLVSKPLEGEPSKVLTLSDIRAMQPSPSSNNSNQSEQQNNNGTPIIQETRVALSANSIVELVNGGVNLPEGVEQEFYVVEDKRN